VVRWGGFGRNRPWLHKILHGGTEENLGEISTTIDNVLAKIRGEHLPALVSLH
jgi:hypothetical protein